MKNGIWHPADFEGKMPEKRKQKKKQQLPSHMSRGEGTKDTGNRQGVSCG